ncbi:hypothetical protein NUSPORA_01331 [Nucleospora cyclopteri]
MFKNHLYNIFFIIINLSKNNLDDNSIVYKNTFFYVDQKAIKNSLQTIESFNPNILDKNYVFLNQVILYNALNELENIFNGETPKDITIIPRNELLNISNILAIEQKYNEDNYNLDFDFDLNIEDINVTIEYFHNIFNISFVEEDVLFFKGFDITKILNILDDISDSNTINLIKKYEEFIKKIKTLNTMKYLQLKNLIQNEVNAYNKYKANFEFFKFKYNLFLKNFYSKNINSAMRSHLYIDARSYLRDFLNSFNHFVHNKMNIKYFLNAIEILIELSLKLNRLTNFICLKYSTNKAKFFSLNKIETNSSKVKRLLFAKIKKDQILKVNKSKQSLELVSEKQYKLYNNVIEAKTQVENVIKEFLISRRKFRQCRSQLYKYKHITPCLSKNNILNSQKRFENLQKNYLNLLKLKQQAQYIHKQTIDTYIKFIKYEKNELEEVFFVEYYYLQYILKNLDPLNFFEKIIRKIVNLEINLINCRYEMLNQLLIFNENIYRNKQYEFLEKILEEKNILIKAVQNDLKIIKKLLEKNTETYKDLIYNIIRVQEELFSFEKYYSISIFIKQIKLLQSFIGFEFINYKIFLEFKLIQFCQTLLMNLCSKETDYSQINLRNYGLFIITYEKKLANEKLSYELFITTLINTRISLNELKNNVRLKRLNIQRTFLDKIKMKLIIHKHNTTEVTFFIKKTMKKIKEIETANNKMLTLNNLSKKKLHYKLIDYRNIQEKYNLCLLKFKFGCKPSIVLRQELINTFAKFITDIEKMEEIISECEQSEIKLDKKINTISIFSTKILENYNKPSDSIKNEEFNMALYLNRQKFYSGIMELYFYTGLIFFFQEFCIASENFNNTLKNIFILKNNIISLEKTQISICKDCFVVESYKKLVFNENHLLFNVTNNYSNYISTLNRILFHKYFILEIKKMSENAYKNFLNLKDDYQTQKFNNNFFIINAQQHYENTLSILKRSYDFYSNFRILSDKTLLSFEKNMILLKNNYKIYDEQYEREKANFWTKKQHFQDSLKKKENIFAKYKNFLKNTSMSSHFLIIMLFIAFFAIFTKKIYNTFQRNLY